LLLELNALFQSILFIGINDVFYVRSIHRPPARGDLYPGGSVRDPTYANHYLQLSARASALSGWRE